MGQKWSQRLLVTRSALQTLISGSQVNFPGFYLISNGVGSTKLIRVEAKANNGIGTDAFDLTSNQFGYYDITADTFTPLAVAGSPDTVNTTNATPTTISTIAVASNKTAGIICRIAGRRTGGTSGTTGDAVFLEIVAALKNIAGTLTNVGETYTFNIADNANCGATIVVSGTNALVQVIGDANNNYSWSNTPQTIIE